MDSRKHKSIRKHWLLYSNDVYGHMLAAIVERYLKKEYFEDEIKYVCNKPTKGVTEVMLPDESSLKGDWVWILGETPSPNAMTDVLKFNLKPDKVFWYDYHKSRIDNVLANPDSQGIILYPGFRTSMPVLGVRLWLDLFPNESVPPYIEWVDHVMCGKYTDVEFSFYLGLTLMHTDPYILSQMPPIEGADENDPSNIWEVIFQTKKEISIDDLNPTFEWGAIQQVVNMGNTIQTWIIQTTENAWLNQQFIKCSIKGYEGYLCCTPIIDLQTAFSFLKENVPASFVGWYTFYKDQYTGDLEAIVTIVSNDDTLNMYELVKEYTGAWGNEHIASCTMPKFTTDLFTLLKK